MLYINRSPESSVGFLLQFEGFFGVGSFSVFCSLTRCWERGSNPGATAKSYFSVVGLGHRITFRLFLTSDWRTEFEVF